MGTRWDTRKKKTQKIVQKKTNILPKSERHAKSVFAPPMTNIERDKKRHNKNDHFSHRLLKIWGAGDPTYLYWWMSPKLMDCIFESGKGRTWLAVLRPRATSGEPAALRCPPSPAKVTSCTGVTSHTRSPNCSGPGWATDRLPATHSATARRQARRRWAAHMAAEKVNRPPNSKDDRNQRSSDTGRKH